MLKTKPISPAGGVEVLDLDVTADLDAATKAELVDLFDKHGLLHFRRQKTDKVSLIKVTKIFGTPEPSPLGDLHDSEYPEIGIFGSRGAHGEFEPEPDEIVGKVDWHTDGAYVSRPNRGGVMCPVEIPPEGGMTGFIDMKRLWDELDEDLKAKVDGLSIILSWALAHETIRMNPTFRLDETGADPNRFPRMLGRAVRPHPRYGAKCLHVPPFWSEGFLELDDPEARPLLDAIEAHVRNPKYEIWHSYQPGDIVAWDNWRMMHAASGTLGVYHRTMHRTVIRGEQELSITLDEARQGRQLADIGA